MNRCCGTQSGATGAKVTKFFHSTCAQDTQSATGSWSQVRFLLVHDADVAQETAVPAMPYWRVAAGLLMTPHQADQKGLGMAELARQQRKVVVSVSGPGPAR